MTGGLPDGALVLDFFRRRGLGAEPATLLVEHPDTTPEDLRPPVLAVAEGGGVRVELFETDGRGGLVPALAVAFDSHGRPLAASDASGRAADADALAARLLAAVRSVYARSTAAYPLDRP